MGLNKKNIRQLMFLIIFAAFMLWLIFNYALFIDLIGYLITLLMPLIVGIAIAFVINIPMKKIETKIFKIQKRKCKKLIRLISLILSIIIIIGILVLIMFLVIPEFIEAIINMTESIPKSYIWVDNLLVKIKSEYPEIWGYISTIDIKSLIMTSIVRPNNMVSVIVSLLSGFISKIVVLFAGFIIAIYILVDKEKLVSQTKKILNAFLSEKATNKIVSIVKLSNNTFTSFLAGQCLDSSLIGFLLFLILTILKLPYALILGVLFAVTALIPYVGAFIALAVGIVLIGVVNPIGALWYAIIFLLLQQFDDNFTHPRIVGGSVGLPALLSILAVLIGGSMFGIIGMIISIPLASVLYSLLKDFVNERLKNKKELTIKKN